MSHSLLDRHIERLLKKDQELLEKTRFPIVTVSATFREELNDFHGFSHHAPTTKEVIPKTSDVVFSRAHFSMALGVATCAWICEDQSEVSKQTARQMQSIPLVARRHRFLHTNAGMAWLVDPTNYVSSSGWKKIAFTEVVGKIIARTPILKRFKDLIDKSGRQKLPIRDAITPPLLHICSNIQQPIISLHNETGNVLAAVGKKVVQVVTDPYVRDEYLTFAPLPNIKFCVFDEKTKTDAIERAALIGKSVDPDRVIVTGPPIDPRIVAARKNKRPSNLRTRPLRICVTTGGLGTNKQEIEKILRELFDFLRMRPHPIQILCYTGTQKDFAELVERIARDEHIAIEPLENESARFRMITGDHIVDVNEQLVTFGFPWADCFITKPSGDMAYDAAAAGCSLLFLKSWGVWEDHVRDVFEQLGVGRIAETEHIKKQLQVLRSEKIDDNQSWFEDAQEKALTLPDLFLHGAKEILRVADGWK